jgi:hypothetical protein
MSEFAALFARTGRPLIALREAQISPECWFMFMSTIIPARNSTTLLREAMGRSELPDLNRNALRAC